MKLCRFTATPSATVRIGLITNDRTALDLADADVHRMQDLLERADLPNELVRLSRAGLPEIFFKSLPEKAVSPGEAVGIRQDARWNVPEPELAMVINSSGKIVGFTIGNDMSSRDIEGENLLFQFGPSLRAISA